MKLQGLCAVVTGASQGLGFEIAKQFLKEGASVFVCARHVDTLKKAELVLQSACSLPGKLFIKTADVSDRLQMEALMADAHLKMGKIDVLVANAGVYGPKGPIDEIDWDEWSDAIDINLKGTVLQCRAILPYFKKQRSGKIIILSGGGATKPMPYLSAYAASKAAVVRFAETLAHEVAQFNIDVNTVAPGALNTRLLDEVLQAGPEKVGADFYAQSLKQKNQGGTSLTVGADLCTFLASSVSKGITGKLISAVWDPWSQMPALLKDLQSSDIYTLRRIVPEDRDITWEVSK